MHSPQPLITLWKKKRYRSPPAAVLFQLFFQESAPSIHTTDHIKTKQNQYYHPTALHCYKPHNCITNQMTPHPVWKVLQSFHIKQSTMSELTEDRCCFPNTDHSDTLGNPTLQMRLSFDKVLHQPDTLNSNKACYTTKCAANSLSLMNAP